jgi:hypothetical protein
MNDAKSRGLRSDYLPIYSRYRLRGNRDRFLVEILNRNKDTEERGATWTTVKPKGDGIVIVGTVDGLQKHVVQRSIGAAGVEIACVYVGAVVGGVSLTMVEFTGTFSILSAAGALRLSVTSMQTIMILFMVIYLSMINLSILMI